MKAASQRDIEAYKELDQSIWLARSNAIIQHISTELKNKYIYFPDLIQDLALERGDIARAMQDKNAKKFGSFCPENMSGMEIILKGDARREEVIPVAEALLKQGKATRTGVSFTFTNPFMHLMPQSDQENKRKKAIWASDVLHQNKIGCGQAYRNLMDDYRYGVNQDLSTIHKSDDSIWLSYRPYNRYNLVGDYFSAQALYDDLINWNPDSDLDSLMVCAAKFSYLMVHGFFVRRGMAAMTEWTLRGIASYHGLKTGDFKEDALGWPWRALTSNLDDYIAWFKTNSFEFYREKTPVFQGAFFAQQSGESSQSLSEASTSGYSTPPR